MLPSPSPAACIEFDLARRSQPFVVLRFPDDPEDDVREGLNGTHRFGDALVDDGDWHQPSPPAALAVERAQALVVLAYIDDGGVPTCLDGVTVDAAPFSPLALAPEPAALVRLADSGADDPATGAFAFGAPVAAGEWIVRVTLTFDTEPGPSHQESFFRLRVDTPPPTVDGRASAPVACARAGESPPRVLISVDGGPWIRAEGGSFTWRGISADGSEPNGPLVEAANDARFRVRIGDDVCAAWWSIQLAPRPAIEWHNQEPISDLVPDTLSTYYNDPPGEANRFNLAPIPPGDWVVQANLWFGSGPNELVGQTSSFWNVVVR
jgi:hypothetical protein